MNTNKRDAFRYLSPMHDPFKLLMGRSLGNWPMGEDEDSNVITSRWVPNVDIKEDDAEFRIVADIPGVEPRDIEVTMDQSVLSIKGERSSEEVSEENGFKRIERSHGSFHRRFSLPDTANGDEISASGKNGVLEIVIPKREAAQSRRIDVNG